MAKQKTHYSIAKLKKEKAQYNVLLGERSNGKSYQVKQMSIEDAYILNRPCFVYLRRWADDIKNNYVTQYFADAPVAAITNHEYEAIVCDRRYIYLCNYDDDHKPIKGPCIGYAWALNEDERLKSQATPGIRHIIYEEFVTNKMYLPDEPTRLQNLVSTIARDGDCQVWLIGNKISRVNPYYGEWGLKNIPRQKPGTIDTYTYERYDEVLDQTVTTKICVEHCESAGSPSKMFFGQAGKSIAGGQWETKEVPHLPDEESECVYELLYEDMGFRFVVQLRVTTTGGMFIYVYPYTKSRRIARVISKEFSSDLLHTPTLRTDIRAEYLMHQMMVQKKICYSDNLTGADYKQLTQAKGGIL